LVVGKSGFEYLKPDEVAEVSAGARTVRRARGEVLQASIWSTIGVLSLSSQRTSAWLAAQARGSCDRGYVQTSRGRRLEQRGE